MKRLALAVSALALIMTPITTALATSADNASAATGAINYLSTQQGSDGKIAGFSGVSYWAAIAYAAAGADAATVKISGGTSLLDYLKSNPPAPGTPATDWERDILAITAAGQNPYNFNGTSYVAALEALDSGSQIGSPTAVNDDFFGIAALAAARVPATKPALTDALSFTLTHQHADGGFSYTTDASTGSDVDDTAAALMALHAASHAGLAVSSTVITNAKNYILDTKNTDGGFPYDPNTPAEWGGPVSNVSSTSWVVMALAVLGDGGSTSSTGAQTFLRSQQQTDGSFPYTAPGAGDTSDTADAVIALAGGFWPLHVYDGPLPGANTVGDQSSPSPSPSPSASPGPSASPSPTPSPSPSPSPQTGSVLGTSTSGSESAATSGAVLPVTGTAANFLSLLFTLMLSVGIAAIAYLRTRRQSKETMYNNDQR